MLKIVYPICCGIDVHKTFVIPCIASTNEVGITKYQSKRFSTFTKGLRELRSVVSDTFSKSSMNIIEHILENQLDKNIDIP